MFPNIKKLSSKELSVILPKAQAGDYDAMERLCGAYVRLIYKLSHRKSAQIILGEDAENTAWLWFLEFVNNYHDYNFDKFPGLVRRYLIFKFVRLMKQQGARWDKETKSDTTCDDNLFGGAEDDNLTNLLNSISLQQEFARLTPKQKKILRMYFGGRYKQREIAAFLKCGVRTVGYQRDLAVKLIRDRFYQPLPTTKNSF